MSSITLKSVEQKTKKWSVPILSFLSGVFLAYVAFYLNGVLTQQQQIAEDLAQFYSSAAAEFYTARDLSDGPDVNTNAGLYQIGDTDYRNFLAASTRLAIEVPPRLKDEVLNVENLWNDVEFTDEGESRWFAELDKVRADILDSISYHKIFNPLWK